MNLLKAPSMASKAAELAPAPLGPVGGCERSERLEEIAGSALNHCLCSGRRSESAARIPTGSGDGSEDGGRGHLHRLTVFVRHENVMRLLEFLGYHQEE